MSERERENERERERERERKADMQAEKKETAIYKKHELDTLLYRLIDR